LRTLVVEEAVFDRAELPHVINLLDMHSKYAHVMQMSQLSERLDKWAGARRSV
jgi:hypothetical protein